MTEVLVTLIIVMVGLLGIAGLQAKAQVAELESYQRAQALIILSDIVDRMNVNREAVACFAITTDTTNGTPRYEAAIWVRHHARQAPLPITPWLLTQSMMSTAS